MKRVLNLSAGLLIGLLIFGCALPHGINEGNTDGSNEAVYTVRFESTWSSTTHPVDFPTNAHFSGLIGATHNEDVEFWRDGKIASDGIESMAETGSKNALIDEITAEMNTGNAETLISGDGLDTSPDSVSVDFDITVDYPKVTLVSMIAPSPDWFVGVSGLDLNIGGDWVEEKSVDLFAYDAGTDSGTTYKSDDMDTNPKKAIMRIETGAFDVNGDVPKLGTFVFKKK